MAIKTIRIKRTEAGALAISQGDIVPYAGWGADYGGGELRGTISMPICEFIERFQPHTRPTVDLVINFEDIGHEPAFEQLKLRTVLALRKALRNPSVTNVRARTSLLGESAYQPIPASRVKSALKGRDSHESIEGVVLAGSTIFIEE